MIGKTTLCKTPANIVIKGNEEADTAAKQAIDMSGMTTTRLPNTDYYLTTRKTRNSECHGKGNMRIILAIYNTLNHALKNGKVSIIAVGSTNLN